MKTLIKKTFDFGKIPYRGNRRIYSAKVELELTDKGRGLELSICGEINNPRGRCVSGGQNMENLREYLGDNETFCRLTALWEKYHLNGLRAGTSRQLDALKAADIHGYDASCEYLKSIGLYVDTLADDEFLSCETEMASRNHYEFGCGWILKKIPAAAIAEIADLCGVAA